MQYGILDWILEQKKGICQKRAIPMKLKIQLIIVFPC